MKVVCPDGSVSSIVEASELSSFFISLGNLYPGIFVPLLSLSEESLTHSRSKSDKSDAIITSSLSLQWSFLTTPLMFQTPHLTLLSVGEEGLAGLQAVTSGLRSAVPDPRLPTKAVARGAIGMSGAVMFWGRWGTLHKVWVGKLCVWMGSRWVHIWRSVEGLEGVKGRVGLDGVVLVFGALSISPIFPVLVLSPKKGFGCKSGLTLTFRGSLPCSHVITSPCRVVLGPSHLKPFHLPSNSEFGT